LSNGHSYISLISPLVTDGYWPRLSMAEIDLPVVDHMGGGERRRKRKNAALM
jgi:hypothetical protein